MSRVLPILFNTDMTKAILDGRKTATRRLAKNIPTETHLVEYLGDGMYECYWGGYQPDTGAFVDGSCTISSSYVPGDILYVRETWGNYSYDYPDSNASYYLYRADYPDGARTYEFDGITCDLPKWRPSIHMPKEAARIWLKVTDVRVERLQDITEVQAQYEGCNSGMLTGPCTARGQFENLWNSTIKKSDLDRYGWNANQWVWVIEFERCEKPEGE
ncbi:MAG: hypothetical protein K2N01_12825 [Lachnospiraceae bacterium]|nr:hypothetical protein [Lachnospiraceae bacterium]